MLARRGLPDNSIRRLVEAGNKLVVQVPGEAAQFQVIRSFHLKSEVRAVRFAAIERVQDF